MTISPDVVYVSIIVCKTATHNNRKNEKQNTEW